MNELLTVAQVADMLSVSKQTVISWDKRGKLKAERHPINNYRVYRRSNIEAISLFPENYISEDQFTHLKPKKSSIMYRTFRRSWWAGIRI
jgi:DNA (cytosine-5)-methyltransferase 1